MPHAFVAFNFGVQQNMLDENWNRWKEHSKQLAKILENFADCGADFIFGCELGGLRAGVKKANINMDKIVHSVLPHAECETSGACFAVHNCLPLDDARVTSVQSCIWQIPCGRKVDLFWQIFTVGYRDDDDDDYETTRGAAQSADSLASSP